MTILVLFQIVGEAVSVQHESIGLSYISLLGSAWAVLALGLGSGIVLLVQVVSWFLWLATVRTNLVALGIPGLRFTPGWSVAWFFVPIMNLFRPWQIVKETVQASQTLPVGLDSFAWKAAPYSPLVHWWWWLPLGLSAVNFGLSFVPTGEGYSFLILDVLTSTVWFVLTFLLVRQITALQEARYAALNTYSI